MRSAIHVSPCLVLSVLLGSLGVSPAPSAGASVPPRIVVASSHTGGVSDFAFSGDGKLMASVAGPVIKLWDASHFREIGAIPADCRTLAFSADGASLVCESPDEAGLNVSGWETLTGRPLFTAHLRVRRAARWVLVPGGQQILLRTGAALRQIELRTGKLIHEYPSRPEASSPAACLAVSADARFAAAGAAATGRIAVWDLTRKTLVRMVEAECHASAKIALSRDARLLTVAGGDETRVYDLAGGTPVRKLPKAANTFFDPSGRRLAIVRGDDLAVYEAPAANNIGEMNFGQGEPNRKTPWDRPGRRVVEPISAAAFSAGGRYVVSSIKPRRRGDISPIKVYDLDTGKITTPSAGRIASIHAIALQRGGKLLAVGAGQSVAVWDVEDGALLQLLDGSDHFNDLAFSPGGGILTGATDAYLAQSGGIPQWEAATGKPLPSLDGTSELGRSHVRALAYHPGGRVLASAGRAWRDIGRNPILLWNLTARRPGGVLDGHEAWIRALAFSPDGERLASATGGNDVTPARDERHSVALWSVGQTKPLWEEVSLSAPVAFAGPASLVAGNGQGDLVIWDSASLTRTAILRHLESGFGKAAVSARAIAGGEIGGGIVVWERSAPGTGRRTQAHSGPVTGLLFSADGEWLWSAGGDGAARLWRLTGGGLAPAASLYFFEDGVSVITDARGRFDTNRLDGIDQYVNLVYPDDPARRPAREELKSRYAPGLLPKVRTGR